jgi:hypothetical protein
MSRISSMPEKRVLQRLSPFAVVLSLLAAPALAAAQSAAPSEPAEVEVLVAELRQLGQQLETIREKALEDQQLQQDQEELGEEIKAAMEKVDPELSRGLERISMLDSEASAAQQANDRGKLEELAREAEAIQMRFIQVRSRVIEEPAMSEKIEAFHTRLETRMAQVDPSTPGLIRRFNELETRLEESLRQGVQHR